METKFSEIAKRLNAEIEDENLKEFVFRSTEPDGDDLNGISVLYRMLLFTFFCAFSKYKADKREKKLTTEFPNALRVFNSFECIYNGEDISFDLVIYVLTEMQIDVITNRNASYFYRFFSCDEQSLQIPSIRRPIKTWLHSAKLAEQDNKVILDWFIGLYDSLEILRYVKLKKVDMPQEEDNVWYNKQKYNYLFIPEKPRNAPGREVVSHELMFIDQEDNELYYLGSYENLPNGISSVSYYTLDGNNVQKLEVPTHSFLINTYTTNNNSTPKSIFAKSLFTIGFKYIKNLSFAVCDIMTTEMKQILYENYNNKYSDIFESKYSKKRRYDVNWDNALTILMFEEGPSKILELIVDSNGMCFEKILKNLEMRYHEKGFEKRIKSVFEAEQKKEMDAIRRGINYSDSIVSNIQILNKTLMARCIIDGLVELEHNQIYSGTQFVESLPMRISSLKKITLTDTLYTQGIKISKILEKTFRFIIPFYCGIIAFQRCKDNALLKSESQNDGNINYEECEAAFFSAARAKAEELARATLGQLVESFREFAGSLRQDDGKRQRVTEDGKALKAAIGRDYFCSLKTFNKIISLKAGGYFNGEIKEIESDIVGYINNIKHENGKEGDVFYLSEEFVLKVKQLLYYFIYNEDFEREMVLGQQISYDPIYPYVVRYTEKSENRDGYQINGFSIFYDADNGVKEVKILSDRKYQINEKYYCIPNVTMSNSRWWIEPFLINCRKYDDLLRDVRMKYDKKKSDSTNKNDDEDKNYADEEWADKN